MCIASFLLAAVAPLSMTENTVPGDHRVITNLQSVLESKAESADVSVNSNRIMYLYELHSGTNGVAVCITNYESGVYSPDYSKLVIREIRGTAETVVYSSHVDITNHIHSALFDPATGIDQKINTVSNFVEEVKADKAWQKYCSDGTPAPSNAVVISTPTTVFAAGYEWARAATAAGSVCVLSARNAQTAVTSDSYATFKFQHDLTGKHFGYVLNGYVELGVDSSSIAVDDDAHTVTLSYDVVMAGYPIIYARPSLEGDVSDPLTWERLSTRDGAPVPGASHVVTWITAPDERPKTCVVSGTVEPIYFYRAAAGNGLDNVDSLFETDMPADLRAGLIAPDAANPDQVHVIEPYVEANASTGTMEVKWRVK